MHALLCVKASKANTAMKQVSEQVKVYTSEHGCVCFYVLRRQNQTLQ